MILITENSKEGMDKSVVALVKQTSHKKGRKLAQSTYVASRYVGLSRNSCVL